MSKVKLVEPLPYVDFDAFRKSEEGGKCIIDEVLAHIDALNSKQHELAAMIASQAAPERSEDWEKEGTGIDWKAFWSERRLTYGRRASSSMLNDDEAVNLLEEAAQIALASRPTVDVEKLERWKIADYDESLNVDIVRADDGDLVYFKDIAALQADESDGGES